MAITKKIKKLILLRQDGFSLLEVLVAIVVLALGLLGLAGLQITSLQGGHGAYLRAQAALLAYDMGDRIRANQADIDGYAHASGAAPACVDEPSTAGSVAEDDLADWLNSLACLLPGGNGSVAIDLSGDTDIVTISIVWADRQGDDDSLTDGTFEFRIEL